jgi:hypothetical protein
MSEMSDFQKQFMAKGVGNTLFTQKEFDDALTLAQAEIMAMAIEASKTAVLMEREACAKIVENFGSDKEINLNDMAELIRNRIPSQRQ